MSQIIDAILRLRDQFTPALIRARSQLEQTAKLNERIGRDLQRTGRSISGIGEAMMPMATGIAVAGMASIKTFATFDDTMLAVKAKAGATGEEYQKLRDVAANLGATTSFSASQAAEGMNMLAAAGFNSNQIIGAMPGMLDAAAASQTDLATISEITSNALNIFGLKVNDTNQMIQNTNMVADVLTATANKTNASIQDLGTALAYAGPPANTLHVSIQELSAAMGIMKNNGLEASTVGTSLRAVLSRLGKPPKEAAETIAELGIQTKKADGNFVGLQSVIGQLSSKFAGLSDMQQVAYAKTLAGEDAYSGLLALIKAGPVALADLTNELNNCSGSASKAAQEMNSGIGGALRQMEGSIETIMLGIGQQLTPYIRIVSNEFQYLAQVWQSLSPQMQANITALGLASIGFVAFTTVLGGAVSAIGAYRKLLGSYGGNLDKFMRRYPLLSKLILGLKNVFAGFNLSLLRNAFALNRVSKATLLHSAYVKVHALALSIASAAVNLWNNTIRNAPALLARFTAMLRANITFLNLYRLAVASVSKVFAVLRIGLAFLTGPVMLAIIALAAAAYYIYTNWDKLRPYFMQVWEQIVLAFNNARQIIMPAVNALKNAFAVFFNSVSSQSSALSYLTGLFILIANIVGPVFGAALISIAGLIGTVLATAINTAANFVAMLIGVFAGIITFITGVFAGDWTMAWQGIVQIFDSIVNGIQGTFEAVIDGLGGAINSLINGANSISIDVPDWVPAIGGSHFQPSIPLLAGGTDNWPGGPAVIHDAGAELVDLPTGARVIPHDKSLQNEYQRGKAAGINNGGNIVVNFYGGVTINNDDDIKSLAVKVAREIAFQQKVRAVNLVEGAI